VQIHEWTSFVRPFLATSPLAPLSLALPRSPLARTLPPLSSLPSLRPPLSSPCHVLPRLTLVLFSADLGLGVLYVVPARTLLLVHPSSPPKRSAHAPSSLRLPFSFPRLYVLLDVSRFAFEPEHVDKTFLADSGAFCTLSSSQASEFATTPTTHGSGASTSTIFKASHRSFSCPVALPFPHSPSRPLALSASLAIPSRPADACSICRLRLE